VSAVPPDTAAEGVAALLREVNSRLAELYVHLDEHGECVFLCECGDRGCGVGVELTIDEYAVVRANPRRYAVVTGHELTRAARVVETGARYTVLEAARP
jgi:predicted NBD/HSP70 family sugar kinase